jgi:hypothetical protein
MSRIFFTEYYKFQLKARDEEVLTSIRNNLKVFDKVVTVHDGPQCPIEGVINIDISKRATFKTLFEIANSFSKPGDTVVVSNSDIYFDSSLSNLGVLDSNTCVTLTRYEDGTLYTDDLKGSQDSWIFTSPIRVPEKSDFFFGIPGCDNHILYLLKNIGYHIENFCYDIKSHHLHSSAFRTATQKDRIGDRLVYHYIEPRSMKLREPSSFCTIATNTCIDEFVAHVCSLFRWHPGVPIYAIVDSETEASVKEWLPFVNLIMYSELDEFSGKTREQMEQKGTWTRFQMLKSRAISLALSKEKDVLYLDSDILVLHKLYIDPTYEIGLSPHLIRKEFTDKYGYYNGGMLWTRAPSVCDDWNEASKTSRFFDQAALEELPKKYTTFEFDESYNVSWWRMNQSDTPPKFNLAGGPCVGEKFIKCVHTHFANQEYARFNQVIIQMLVNSRQWVELLLIERIINKKWVLLRPKQPLPFPHEHTNDSFRELMPMLQKGDVITCDASGITVPRLGQFVCLYDRDTAGWLNDESKKSIKTFVGNLDVQDDFGDNPTFSPWVYWPRHPKIIETFLEKAHSETRDIKSIFIGNIENDVQKSRRSEKWSRVIEVFHLTESKQKKFTQEEYLRLLSRSRYGLSMMGYGVKCHREIELMALGVVPLILEGVSTRSYQEPLVEGVHFFRIKEPEDVTKIIESTSESQWQEMSLAGQDWFMRNVHSKNMWHTFLKRILCV